MKSFVSDVVKGVKNVEVKSPKRKEILSKIINGKQHVLYDMP